MSAQPNTRVSWEEFEQFILRPEHDDRLFEYVNGEIIEVAVDFWASVVGASVGARVGGFVMQHKLGYTTAANGGYRFGNDALMPSCAFVAKDHRLTPSDEYYPAIVPALMVEVKARGETYASLLTKVAVYLKHGVDVVWLVLPHKRRVEVFTEAGLEVATLDDTLDGGTVMPGFTLKVSDIFANLE